jgi:hypothetical protein
LILEFCELFYFILLNPLSLSPSFIILQNISRSIIYLFASASFLSFHKVISDLMWCDVDDFSLKKGGATRPRISQCGVTGKSTPADARPAPHLLSLPDPVFKLTMPYIATHARQHAAF